MNLSTDSIADMLRALQDDTLSRETLWEHFDDVSTRLDPEIQAYNSRVTERPTASE